MKILAHFCSIIDGVNEWVGRAMSWGLIVISLVISGEVVLRYFFNRPTIWSWDISIYINVFAIMLSAGYVYLHNEHVSVDIFIANQPRRRRELMALIISAIFFLAIAVLIWRGTELALASFARKERMFTALGLPLYPLRMAIAAGAILLALQGMTKFIRSLFFVIFKKDIK